MAALRLRVERWRDQLVASDPGRTRFELAGRTVASLALALAVLYGITRVAGEPVTVALLGVVVAMISSMAVNDDGRRAQAITLALLPVPAGAAVALGALLAGEPLISEVVFVAIMFTATWVRRFGPRGMALGMVAFMGYFFALFLGASIGRLPWLLLALAVGTACSALVRFLLLRDRPDRRLPRTLRSLRARLASVIDVLLDAFADGQLDERRRRQLRRRMTRLNETALMVEDQLGHVDVGDVWHGADRPEVTLSVLDVELGAGRLARAGAHAATDQGVTGDVRRLLVARLRALRRALRAEQVQPPPDAQTPADVPGAARAVELALDDMAAALARAREITTRDGAAASRDGRAEREEDTDGEDRDGEDEDGGRLAPTTQTAIQVAVATAAAIAAGELISPRRWYWAVIAAFVIFTGTSSRGEVLTKGWQRVVGTLAGVVGGAAVAAVVGGDVPASVVLIFVCVFFAFSFVRVSYGLMSFFITTVLALLYGLLGQFSYGVLLLRLEETAAGAAIGIAVAVVVLPTSTRGTVREKAGDFLDRLDDVVDGSLARLAGRRTDADLHQAARDLDGAFQDLRQAARPLTRGPAAGLGRSGIHRAMLVLMGCAYEARNLARLAEQAGPDGGLDAAAVERAGRRVRENIAALRRRTEREEPGRLRPADPLIAAVDAPPGLARGALRALRGIDGAVIGLARDLELDVAEEPEDEQSAPAAQLAREPAAAD